MSTIGVSAKLEYESGSTFVEIPDVISVNFPEFSVTSIDTTSLANTDYGMTFAPGMVDGGTITFECHYDSDVYDDLEGLVRTSLDWKVSAPTGESQSVTCEGFLTKLSVSIKPNELVVISGEIKMTGLPTVA